MASADWPVLAEYFSARATETEAAHKALMARLRLYSGWAPAPTQEVKVENPLLKQQQQQPKRRRTKSPRKFLRRSSKPCDHCHEHHRRCDTPDGTSTKACKECTDQKVTCSFV